MEKGEKILQIFESSACLKADQMLGYLKGNLFQEELRVVELHLASCNLCQEALEGLENHDNIKNLLDNLSAPTLPTVAKKPTSQSESNLNAKSLFPPTTKAIHTTPSLPKSTFINKNQSQISRQRNMSWLGIGGIAALLLLGGFLFWQYENSRLNWKNFSFATNDTKEPGIADSNLQNEDTLLATAATTQHIAPKNTAVTPKTADSTKKTIVAAIKTSSTDSVEGILATTNSPEGVKEAKIASDNALRINKDSQNNQERNNAIAATTSPKPESKTNELATAKTKAAEPKQPSAETASVGSSDYQTGKSLFQKKQYASALLYLRSATENNNDPHHVEAMYYSALCNLQIGKNGRAKRLLKKVEKTDSPFATKASEQLEQL